jgi:putative spermidine/putrescine transport system substrate-binding protein
VGVLLPADTKLEGDGTVIHASWGGTLDDYMRKGQDVLFAKYYNGKVKYETADPAKFKSMTEAGVIEWDVTGDIDMNMIAARDAGYLAKLDYAYLPQAQEIDAVARQEYYVGGEYESYILAFQKEKYGDKPPTGWADFFDVENFPGARSLNDYAPPNVDAALLADGVPGDKLWDAHKEPDSMDRAFKKLEALKATGAIKKFWGAGAEAQQLMKDREVDMLNCYNGRISSIILTGADYVGMEWNQAIFYLAPFCWVKGAPNGKNGLHYLNCTMMAEAQAILQEGIQYGPTNPKALPLISDRLRPYLPSYPDNLKKSVQLDSEFWAKEQANIAPRWEAFKQG